jgi:integrase
MTKKTVSKVAQIAKKPAVLSRSDAAKSSKPANLTEDVQKRPKTAFSSAADGYIAAAQSHSTKIAYASDIRHFLANGGSIPATTGQVSDYLAKFAENLSVSTLERRLIAIHQAHVEISAPSPALDSVVKRTMQGIRRTLGTKQRQVQPMIRDDLLEVLVMADQQKPVKAARDRALLLIGFAGAFRRSELIAIQVRDLSYLPNGVEIFLNQSKTDQEKQGRTVFIPHALGSRCPVRALAQWLELAEITEGYVFRAVTRHDRISSQGLSAQSVALVVKASVARVGGDKTKVSGHSLRAGYCTQGAIAGLQPWQIREQTGHKSDVTLAKYIRPVARRKIPSLL